MEDKTVLTGGKLEEAVRQLDVGWAVLPGKGLVRVVPTDGFRTGFTLVVGIAKIAEELQHDPEVMLKRDEVEITLNTYEAGGITEDDVVMAKAVDQMIAS